MIDEVTVRITRVNPDVTIILDRIERVVPPAPPGSELPGSMKESRLEAGSALSSPLAVGFLLLSREIHLPAGRARAVQVISNETMPERCERRIPATGAAKRRQRLTRIVTSESSVAKTASLSSSR